ncbi:uncharacterized protein LOC111706376 [Eurytemora carolleeae]|uniref:uncharacterized protein LOC111706376 n=1 Tax=Eurytemora carolleeae TaxID=1294199 RepID=UPI000C766BF0|nr:uncharacterized protein LOC111706376 [Eurytemora carolleeae]|eukprot:XP_023335005.1 uncharacterized protein LOC111706376 [Eurytemora affinis]
MMVGIMKHILAGVVCTSLVTSSPSPDTRTKRNSAFDNIYSAISSFISPAQSFSSVLLPGSQPETERRHVVEENPGFFDRFSGKKSREKIQRKNDQFRPPQFGSIQDKLEFNEPEYEQITQASLGPFKRSPQLNLPGYSYPEPDNKLFLPGEDSRSSMEVILPSDLRSEKLRSPKKTQKMKGKLVFRQDDKEMTGVQALEALNRFLESDQGAELLEAAARQSVRKSEDDFSESATARSLSVSSSSAQRTVTASPITFSSTVGSIRLIQPIQFVSTPRPSPNPQSNSFRSDPRPKTNSFNSILSSRNPSSPKPRFPKQQSPALTFVDNGLVAVLGRQVKGNPVEGFPNGLPELTPLGVRITLENMFGPNGEMVMNPIPGVAGVDYPTFNSVPDTQFSCSAQEYPGIFADTFADCQAFYMCQPNGESTAFLCPNGTMFNQQYFVCDWWYNLDCAEQPNFYNYNQLIYDSPENEGKKCTSLFCKDD